MTINILLQQIKKHATVQNLNGVVSVNRSFKRQRRNDIKKELYAPFIGLLT